MPGSGQESVALYWDFENIHASLYDQINGSGAYRANRFLPQEPLVDVQGIIEFAASFGTVAINKAYCNWLSFSRYRNALLQGAVELIQLFPPGQSAKNGADIKLCLDLTEDMLRFPHISAIVIVGGDSDYMPVSHKVKAAGRTLVGLGSQTSTNQHWAKSCHEFRYYENLTLDSEAAEEQGGEVAGTRDLFPTQLADAGSPAVPTGPDELIRRAIARLSANSGDPWVMKAAIRPMVKRLDPTFNERSYGHTKFSDLLDSYDNLFEIRQAKSDHEVRIKERHGALSAPPTHLERRPASSETPTPAIDTGGQVERGTVKRVLAGYGFIARDAGEPDLFFHSSALRNCAFGDLSVGVDVEFAWAGIAAANNGDKPAATWVALLGGTSTESEN